MRAITVQQPYAAAIAVGAKPVENRVRSIPWGSAIGTRVAIHAGKKWYDGARDDQRVAELLEAGVLDRAVHDPELGRAIPVGGALGAVLAVARLTDVHRRPECPPDEDVRQQAVDTEAPAPGGLSVCSRWAEPDQWHLVLRDVVLLPAIIPARGYQGLWTLTAEQHAAVIGQLA